MNIFQFFGRFRKAFRDPVRKNTSKILFEYGKFKLFKPSVAEQYFHKRLYRKNIINPEDYILTHKLIKRIWHFNDMIFFSILSDKKLAEIFFDKFDLPVVKSLAYNRNTLFFVKNICKQIKDPEQFLALIYDLKKEGLCKGNHLIIKPFREHAGKGILKVDCDELKNNHSYLEKVFNKIIASDFLIQNVIKQHPDLDKINPYSLNTIRVDTFINKHKVPRILSMRLRCSANTSFLDNISNGGLFIGIDDQEGTLHDEGFNDFEKFSGQAFAKHPQTGISFGGFKVPYFTEVKQLAMDAARLLPEAKVVAWDICIQPDGPLIIEGNYFPGLLNSEIVQKGFKNNSVFSEILEELNESG